MKIGLVINFVSSLNVILWYEKHTHTHNSNMIMWQSEVKVLQMKPRERYKTESISWSVLRCFGFKNWIALGDFSFAD